MNTRHSVLQYLKKHPLEKTIFGVFLVCGIIASSTLVYFTASQPRSTNPNIPQKASNTDGKIKVSAQSDSNSGLTQVSALEPDTSPPLVQIVSPADGAVVGGGDMEPISVTTSDNVHVSRIDIWVDSRPLKTCLNKTTCQVDLRVGGLSTGTHTIGAAAKDDDNNETSTQITVSK